MLLLRSHHHLLLHHATRFLRRAAPRPVPLAASFRPFRMSISSDASNSSASSPAPSPPPTVVPKSKIRFCPACGSPTKLAVPDGDEKMRAVCSSCGRVHYENPKMVVGCLVEHENKVLLCMAVCPANLDLVIRSEIYTWNKIYEMDLRRTRGRRRTSQDFAE